MITIPNDIGLAELKGHMIKADIRFRKWRTPRTKTIQDLWEENRKRLSSLVAFTDENGRYCVERHITSVVVDVYRIMDGGIPEKLREKRRISGKLEKAVRTSHSVSGKIEPGERLINAAHRCLTEKLEMKGSFEFMDVHPGEAIVDSALRAMRNGSSVSNLLVKKFMYELSDDDPDSFPGLPTLRELHNYACMVVPDIRPNPLSLCRKHGANRTIYEWVTATYNEFEELKTIRFG